ncbi:MAG: hypothetical protein WBP63_09000, partial [Silvibacterium sp.]
FDIGVKRVDRNAHSRMADRVAERLRVSRRKQEKSFRPIHWLNRQRDFMLIKHVTKLLEALNGPVPFVRGAASSRKISDRRIKRTPNQARSKLRACLNAANQMCEGLFSYKRVRADGIDAGREYGTHCAFQISRFERLSDIPNREARRIKHRNLEAIESVLTNLAQQIKI